MALDSCATEDQELRDGRRRAAGGLRARWTARRLRTGSRTAPHDARPPARHRRPPSRAPCLSAEALQVTFPGRRGAAAARAVDGVDLDIRPGEIVALVGESGCGKTTLARTLLGLVPPDRRPGHLRGCAAGLRAAGRSRRTGKRVQLVLQDPSGSLNPRHTVYDAVAEGLRIHGYAGDERAAVAEALSRAGLRPPERFFLRYPHELSGGQRQRVVIAGRAGAGARADRRRRAGGLAGRVGTGRDPGPAAARCATNWGCRRWSSPTTSGLAWNIADRVAVMYLGRIVETGPVEQVLTAPQHPYTQALLSVLPEAAGEPVVLTGEPPDPSTVPSGCRFHARCQVLASGEAERAGVAEACRTVDLPVLNGGADTQVACHWAAACGAKA